MLSFVVVAAAPFFFTRLVQEVQVEIVAVVLAAAAAAAGSRAPGAGRVHGAVDVAAASASVLLLLLLHVRTLDEAPHWVHGGVVVWRGAHRRAHSTGAGMLLLLLWRLLLLLLWHHVWGHAIAHLAHLQKIKTKKRANII